MRRILNLTGSEKATLESGYKNSKKRHFRNRCHSILLSWEGYSVSEIAKLYKVRIRTIYTWFNRWEEHGITGLMILKGRGVKAKLDELIEQQLEQVKQVIDSDPRSLRNICRNLSELLGYKVTKNMLKRWIKKNSNIHGDVLGSV